MPFNQQLDLDGGRHDIAPAHETVKLFDSAPQIRGQIALDTDAVNPFPYELRRYAHTVGRDNTKYHLVPSHAVASLCGKSASDFNCRLAEGYERRVLTADLVCARCVARMTGGAS